MMLHPTIAQQFAAQRQHDLIDHAARHRQARAAQAARFAGPATAAQTRPFSLRRVRTVLTSH